MEEKGKLDIPDEYRDDIASGKMRVDFDNSRLVDNQTGQIVKELPFKRSDDEDREGIDTTSAAVGAAVVASIALVICAGREALHARKIKREQKFEQLLLMDEASQEKLNNLRVATDIFEEEWQQSSEKPSVGLKSAVGNLIYALEQLEAEERKDYCKALVYTSQPIFSHLDMILKGKTLTLVTKRFSFKKQIVNLTDRLRMLDDQLSDALAEETEVQKVDEAVQEHLREISKS